MGLNIPLFEPSAEQAVRAQTKSISTRSSTCPPPSPVVSNDRRPRADRKRAEPSPPSARVRAEFLAVAVHRRLGARGRHHRRRHRCAATLCHLVAQASSHRRGTTKPTLHAIGRFKKSAQQGFAPTPSMLGNIYYQDDFVPRDVGQALRWYAARSRTWWRPCRSIYIDGVAFADARRL